MPAAEIDHGTVADLRRHRANVSRRRAYDRGERTCGTCDGTGTGTLSRVRCFACGGSGALIDAIRRLV